VPLKTIDRWPAVCRGRTDPDVCHVSVEVGAAGTRCCEPKADLVRFTVVAKRTVRPFDPVNGWVCCRRHCLEPEPWGGMVSKIIPKARKDDSLLRLWLFDPRRSRRSLAGQSRPRSGQYCLAEIVRPPVAGELRGIDGIAVLVLVVMAEWVTFGGSHGETADCVRVTLNNFVRTRAPRSPEVLLPNHSR